MKAHSAQKVPVLLGHAVDRGVAQENLRVINTEENYSVARAVEWLGDGREESDVTASDVRHEVRHKAVDVGTHLHRHQLLIDREDGIGLEVRRCGYSDLGNNARALERFKKREEPDDLGVHGKLGCGERG